MYPGGAPAIRVTMGNEVCATYLIGELYESIAMQWACVSHTGTVMNQMSQHESVAPK